jgi:hypothetical protein
MSTEAAQLRRHARDLCFRSTQVRSEVRRGRARIAEVLGHLAAVRRRLTDLTAQPAAPRT